ncbi:MAG: DUF4907 domain-containing protein [Fluviicola sp.]|nr:DUF4907 domain-containing protein [Fluviicola sp.]
MIRYLIPFVFLVGCSNDVKENITPPKKDTIPQVIVEPQKTDSGYKYKVVFEENNGWGYQIFEGDKMLINQMHIPAIQGLQSFSTEEKARITAEFILLQVEQGNFPPTVTKETLDSLGVLN